VTKEHGEGGYILNHHDSRSESSHSRKRLACDIDSAAETISQCSMGKCYVNACGGAGCATYGDVGCLCADGTQWVSSSASSVGSSALVTLVGALLAMVA
jgi:hypothetical protein